MGLKFKVVNYELDVDEQVLLFKDFRDIIDRDDSRNKRRAKQILTYIYLREDLSSGNPLSSMSYDDRQVRSEKIIFGDKGGKFSKAEQEMIDRAISTYVEFSSTPEERLLSTVNDMIDDQNNQMIKLRSTMGKGFSEEMSKDDIIELNDKYNETLKGILNNLKLLNSQKKAIVDQLKNNMGEKVRADKSTSLIEDGVLLGIKSNTGK